MYDIIGDIHGHALTLEALLQKMGYVLKNEFYQHSERKAIFVGDLIDRGPNILETLHVVKAMYDNGSALVVMGNHEYNAICYNTKGENGRFLRKHSKKNKTQYMETDAHVRKSREGVEFYLEWFKTLPIFLEIDGIRIIHACWDSYYIDYLKKELPDNKMTNDFLMKSAKKGNKEYFAIETLLKGREIKLPLGQFYFDKDGHRRKKIRIQWWKKIEQATYRSLIVNVPSQIIDSKIPEKALKHHSPYLENEPHVFFGHYWKSGKPEIFAKNACCVDYSIAKYEKLVAYQYNGEKKLNNNNFISVENVD